MPSHLFPDLYQLPPNCRQRPLPNTFGNRVVVFEDHALGVVLVYGWRRADSPALTAQDCP
jgi:hypothetical protein